MANKIVAVYWIDAQGHGRTGWRSMREVESLEPAEAISIGFLVKETPKFLLVCPHMTPPDGSGEGDGEIVIPRAWVTRVKVLK